jgi:hypothetical protein
MERDVARLALLAGGCANVQRCCLLLCGGITIRRPCLVLQQTGLAIVGPARCHGGAPNG